MKTRTLFLPVIALTALAAYLGLRLGQPVTETEAITFFATKYSADTGRPASDCSAMLSTRTGIWIEVVCIGPDLTGVIYLVGSRGQSKGTVEMKAPQI